MHQANIYHVIVTVLTVDFPCSKLKRDSGVNFDATSDTERLLQQKEHEVRQRCSVISFFSCQVIGIDHLKPDLSSSVIILHHLVMTYIDGSSRGI
jgi:hypothetical protein